jgi:DeoR/GlpR family transcriptional regulator of sugar metabolism
MDVYVGGGSYVGLVISLQKEERVTWLLDELRGSGSVTLAHASEQLGVGEMTVRRDLRFIEEQGFARRVRGGAVFSGPVSFQGREQSHAEEKQAIARKLLPLVPDSGWIAIDSSSTMNRLAALIPGASDLTVVTNSLETFKVLRGRPGVTPIVSGGWFDERSDSLVGPVATRTLSSFTYSKVFLSAAAMSTNAGTFEDTLEEAELKRAMADSANQVVIGVNGAKLGRRATAASIGLRQVSVLCTELDRNAPALEDYQDLVRQIL